jgi:hypothetical protein
MQQIHECLGREVDGVRALILCGWDGSGVEGRQAELVEQLLARDPDAVPAAGTVFMEENGDSLHRSVWPCRVDADGRIEPLAVAHAGIVGPGRTSRRCWMISRQ